MAYDLEQYRQRLRQATGTGPQQPPTMMGDSSGAGPRIGEPRTLDGAAQGAPMDAVQSIPPPKLGPMEQAAAAPAVQRGPVQGKPQAAVQRGAVDPNAVQPAKTDKPKIPVGPPNFKPEFDEKALKGAKTAPDVMQAMKPESKKTYLDWWENQYGAINKKYESVLQELGKRPDPRRKPNREEMFDMLLEFGLNMIANSRSNNLGTSVANSIGGAVAGHVGRRGQEQAKHAGMVRQTIDDRAAELKGIGNYGEALKGQAEMDMRGAEQTMRNEQTLEAQTRRKKLEGEAPETMDTDVGTAQWDAETKTWKRATMDGQNITRKTVQGSGRGSGGGRDTRVAEQKRYDHLISLNVDPEVALRLAYRQKSGDPQKDHIAIYKEVLKTSFGNEDKAREAADSYVDFEYGEGWRKKKSEPLMPADNDPLGVRKPK